MQDFILDFRYAGRMLRKSPAFTAAAVAMLALGIGANTAIFSLVSAAFLRPLPFPEPDRLVAVWEETRLFGLKYSPPAMGNYMDWRSTNRVFEDMAALERGTFRLTGDGEPEEVWASVVTASLFPVLGVRPVLGRSFLAEEDRHGAPKSMILSYRLWQRRFAGDRGVIGKTPLVNGEKYTIVGVMPDGFRFPDFDNDIWAPMGAVFAAGEFSNRGRHNLMVVARLKRGVPIERASEEIGAISTRLEREYPRTNTGVGGFVAPLREHMTGQVRGQYLTLLAGVGFVLLIACANVANLLLARAAGRQREIAVRAALGAGRFRIARQLLAESLLLSGLGAGLGLLLAYGSFGFLSKLLPGGIAAMAQLSLDRIALGFTIALAVLTAVAFGVAPALQALRVDVNHALKQGGARSGAAASARGLRGALVVAEVALSLLLLVGAGLMIRSFARLRAVDPGFTARNLLTMRVPPSPVKFKGPEARSAYYREMLRRVQALPGVVSAGFTSGLPVAFKGDFTGIAAEGASARNGGEVPTAQRRLVTPGYLETLGVPLHRGRFLEERDGTAAPLAAIVNETMARKFWPGADPLGKRFQLGFFGSDAPWYTVVGVVGDIHQSGLDTPPRPETYISIYQHKFGASSGLAVRTSLEPASLAAAIGRAIREIEPEQVVARVMTMEEVLDRDVYQRRLQSTLLACFSALSILLAALGIYGVLSYLVALRTREFGVRLALGARPADILSGVVRQGATLAAAGIAIGLAAALVLTRALTSIVYGISPRDPWTLASSALLMAAVAVCAGLIPARRATQVDPAVTLREE